MTRIGSEKKTYVCIDFVGFYKNSSVSTLFFPDALKPLCTVEMDPKHLNYRINLIFEIDMYKI